jgi:hypothetical protein
MKLMVTIALFTSENCIPSSWLNIQITELYIMMKTKLKGTFIHATLNRGDAFQRVSYLLRHRIYVNGPGVF